MSDIRRLTIEVPIATGRDLDFVCNAKRLSRSGLLRKLLESFLEQTVPSLRRELHKKQEALAAQGITVSFEELLAADKTVRSSL